MNAKSCKLANSRAEEPPSNPTISTPRGWAAKSPHEKPQMRRRPSSQEEEAEAGRKQRAEAEFARAKKAHLKAVAGPVRQDLTDFQESVQAGQDDAFRAVMFLLDLVDADHQTHDEAIARSS